MSDDAGFPAPGQFYDIGTHKMHLYSLGEGSPVVVLDAGSGDSLLTWNGIQPEIAKFTRVVAYDRSGMGWSERGPNPCTPETIAEDLYKLLLAAEITEPIVLVGHSLGGVYMRAFVHRYPEQVAGLVLVDSSHESQALRFAEVVPKSAEQMSSYVAVLKDLSQKSHAEIVEFFVKSDEDASDSDTEVEAMKRDRLRPSQIALVAEEIEYAYSHSLKQPPEALHSLGDLNLTVLTATKPFAGEGLSEEEGQMMIKTFQELQKEISQRSSQGKQILVKNAGHYIHKDQPQVVIDAIRAAVESVRLKS
jgi:pimeloyl-ACP methyl ester carboxylesterase